MSGNRVPSRSSLGPRSGLAPIKFRWSFRSTRLPARRSARMPPVAAVKIKVGHPELLQHAHRKRDRLEIMPFVIMKSSLIDERGHAAERAQQDFPGMPGHGRARKMGNRGRKGRPSASAIRSASSFKPEPRTTASRGAIGAADRIMRRGLFGSACSGRSIEALRHKRIPAIQAER